MVEHDGHIGLLLETLDDLGAPRTTRSSSGLDRQRPDMNSWPDGAMTPFRSEKNTNWEGGYRVPAIVRWPGHIQPAASQRDRLGHDWLPTLLAAAGEPNVKDRC